MRKNVTQTSTMQLYHGDVQRRLIELLLAVAPDAPIPLTLLENIIATYSLTDGPTTSIADKGALVPAVFGATVDVFESMRDIQRNITRATLTVPAGAQERLRHQYAALEHPRLRRRQASDGIEAPISLTVEMYEAASFLPDAAGQAYSHDQLALLVPHLLHLIHMACAAPATGWWPVQGLTTLWLLNDHGVVATNDVSDYMQRVMAYCEPRYQEWDEWLAVSMFAQAVEEMIAARWEQAPTTVARALAMAEDILTRIDDADERAHYAATIAALRTQIAVW